MTHKRRRGRPPLAVKVHTIQVTLSLREGEDDDVLAFFACYPPRQRARALLMALRQGGVGRETAVGGAFNEAELLEALDDLLF